MSEQDNTTVSPLRRCTKCGIDKPATTEFFHKRTDRDALRSRCKSCINQENKEWSQSHADQVNQYKKEWRHTHKARCVQYTQKWQQKNPEKTKTLHRNYVENNRTRVAEIQRNYLKRHPNQGADARRKWVKTHPEAFKAAQHRHRALKRNADGVHTKSDIMCMRKSQRNRCYYCREKFVDNKFQIDHVIPLSRGGTNSPDNLVLSCPRCNCSKNNRMPHEWIKGGRLF